MISEKRKGKYVTEKSPVHQRIKCITTGKIFETAKEAGQYYGIKSYSHISRCCYGSLKHCGKLDDCTPLEWKFINPTIQKRLRENEGRKKDADKKRKYIVCLNDGKIFKGQKTAGEFYNIKLAHHISEVCTGKCSFCRKHPITLEPLRFIYFKDLNTYLERILNYLKIRKMILDKYLNKKQSFTSIRNIKR